MSGAGDRVIFSVMECSGSRQRWLHTSENTPPISEQSTLPGCQCRENPRSTRTATEPPARRSPPQGGTRGSGALRCAQAWCPAASVQAHGPMRPGSGPLTFSRPRSSSPSSACCGSSCSSSRAAAVALAPGSSCRKPSGGGSGGTWAWDGVSPACVPGHPQSDEPRASASMPRAASASRKCRWPAERGGDPAWGRRALTAEPRAQSGRAHRPPRRDYSRLLPGSATRARCSVATWARPGAQELAQT